MIVQVPVLITTAFFIVGGPVPVQWDTFSVFIHSVNPIGDGMITFLIVKSYMKALRVRFILKVKTEIMNRDFVLDEIGRNRSISQAARHKSNNYCCEHVNAEQARAEAIELRWPWKS
jgi:hypothetical protein